MKHRRHQPADLGSRRRDGVLAVRPDGLGDVLLTGPAVRALAAGGREVSFLAGPAGAGAAALLPGVTRVMTETLPWIDPGPAAVEPGRIRRLLQALRGLRAAEAVIFTSFHQSPLPTALVLRMAGVGRVSAISEDYPGSLLDVRHQVDADIPEARRNLSLARAAGFHASRIDGRELAYNQADLLMPDIVVCPPALAGALLDAIRSAQPGETGGSQR